MSAQSLSGTGVLSHEGVPTTLHDLAKSIRRQVEEERLAAWADACARDSQLDADRDGPADQLMPWQTYAEPKASRFLPRARNFLTCWNAMK